MTDRIRAHEPGAPVSRGAPATAVERMRAGDYEGAWAVLAGEQERLGTDRELALAWMELLEAAPARRGGAAEAERVLEAWPGDPAVVVAACAALVAVAARRPLDEPALEQGPAQRAAQAAERALEALDPEAAADPDRAGYLWINRANALRHAGPEHDEAAREAYEQALRLAPERGGWWFDLGVLHKWRGRFEEAFDCTLRARARLGETKPVLWNLAIAATALGQGDVAARAWRELGIPAQVQDSGMPFVDGLPPVELRVPARGTGTGGQGAVPDRATSFEVVVAAPLSPCHGVVRTPTFRETFVDYGDVVLWDGAPVAIDRRGEDDVVPRFAVLARLRQGDEHKLRFVGLQQSPGDVERLAEDLPEGASVHVHTERVQWLCPRCASGEVLQKHEHEPSEEHRIVYGKLVVPPRVALERIREGLEGALRQRGTVALAIPGLYEALGDTKRAGQQHKAWRGIERSAIKRGLASS